MVTVQRHESQLRRKLGFTPLAEGLTQLALELCTTPDCGLPPPVAGPTGINDAGPEAGATG